MNISNFNQTSRIFLSNHSKIQRLKFNLSRRWNLKFYIYLIRSIIFVSIYIIQFWKTNLYLGHCVVVIDSMGGSAIGSDSWPNNNIFELRCNTDLLSHPALQRKFELRQQTRRMYKNTDRTVPLNNFLFLWKSYVGYINS